MDIFRFVKDGVVYAKGFSNQEGLTFYVLRGYRDTFYAAVNNFKGMRLFGLESTNNLPGEPPQTQTVP
jgi:hypothetical protein